MKDRDPVCQGCGGDGGFWRGQYADEEIPYGPLPENHTWEECSMCDGSGSPKPEHAEDHLAK